MRAVLPVSTVMPLGRLHPTANRVPAHSKSQQTISALAAMRMEMTMSARNVRRGITVVTVKSKCLTDLEFMNFYSWKNLSG